jgi:hypothetical protein
MPPEALNPELGSGPPDRPKNGFFRRLIGK